ncbi:amidohydrolase [Halieaceae bacterium IMCC14734]|uniref:Amidohydrolase n=1 Tax=Candidatus Litorirhabdus singularis TaxID=2518993 RepID=A0ABT3TEM8_9GAMM|nr:amidohydrolase [Candidatus Litorirhabdus singularis]MCX2980767.1 amidohydrolase [Candidatus Litorirhabdus singularis]
MKQNTLLTIVCCLTVALFGCAGQRAEVSPSQLADQVFSAAAIVTMDDGAPDAEMVAVKAGRILAVGSREEIAPYIDTETKIIDLGSATLVPGFIDPHSHFSHAAGAASWANIAGAPVGTMASIADIIEEMKLQQQRNQSGPGEWVVGFGYDADTLSDGRHINRDDLDAAFPDNPVLLIHVSFHGGVLNSQGFAQINYDENTPTPEGGIIVRRPNSNEPLGLLMETAWFPAISVLPRPQGEARFANLVKAQQHYAANGVTTAQDGLVGYEEFELLKEAAARNDLFLDLVALGSYAEVPKFAAEHTEYKGYQNRLKLGGIKIISDGSPQGKTAFFSEPYLTGGPGGEQNWRGEPMMPVEQFDAVLGAVYAADMQAFVHANADAAIDMLLSAHRTHKANTAEDSRTVVIHSQFVRQDQLQAYAKFGMVPAFFSNHAYYWGDVHVENLGVERAHFLSPMRSATELGLHFTNHSDYMVTPLNPMFTVWSAVNRLSRSGQVIGSNERVTPLQALKAITLDAAFQYFEEDQKGSITVGKLADFAVLNANPLTVEPMDIKDIQVLSTYKEGQQIYAR